MSDSRRAMNGGYNVLRPSDLRVLKQSIVRAGTELCHSPNGGNPATNLIRHPHPRAKSVKVVVAVAQRRRTSKNRNDLYR